MNTTLGSSASSGIARALDFLLMAAIRKIPLMAAMGTNNSPNTVMYHAFVGFTTIEA